MKALEFDLIYKDSLRDFAKELADFNLSGCILLRFDDETQGFKELIIGTWLSHIGYHGKLESLKENEIKSYYVFNEKTKITKPVFHAKFCNREVIDKSQVNLIKEYMAIDSAVCIIECTENTIDTLPKFCLHINFSKKKYIAHVEIYLNEKFLKREIDISRLDVDNVCFANKIVLSSWEYYNSIDESKIYGLLDLSESNCNYIEHEYQRNLFDKVLHGVFPYKRWESNFYHNDSFYINFVKNGRIVLVLCYCEGNFIRPLDWEWPNYAVPNDCKVLSRALEEIREPNIESYEVNDKYEFKYILKYEV